MLKISIIETSMEMKIVLEGSLTEAYIPEMEMVWRRTCSAAPRRRTIVDLRNATFIDRKSEELLVRLKREGALFVACGVSTTHQLAALGIPCQEALCKPH